MEADPRRWGTPAVLPLLAVALLALASPARAFRPRPPCDCRNPMPGCGTLCPSGFVSDDFDAANLDRGRWSFVDPEGDASVRMLGTGTADAWLQIDVPAGAAHDVTADGVDAPRVRQAVSNVDFTLAARFESTPLADGQTEGLVVEGDATHFLSVAIEREAGALRLRARSFSDGEELLLGDVALPGPGPRTLRLARSGSLFDLQSSADGLTFARVAFFFDDLAASGLSVFAGNRDPGSGAPAWTALVDFASEASDPLDEDAAAAPDVLPPFLQQIAVRAGDGRVYLQWLTDEPSDSVVRYGLTTAYELGSVSVPGFVYEHAVTVPGLQNGVTYHFEVSSADPGGATAVATDRIGTPVVDHSHLGPEIDVWYGLHQKFGQNGVPQPWANVVGNVQDPDGVASLTYSANGGAPFALRIGPDGLRLQAPGDFNADVPTSALVPGANTVVLTATDTYGNASTATVEVDWGGAQVGLPFTVDWSAAPDLMSVAQPVDGRWVIEDGAVRNLEMGYDRLVTLGDLSWKSYEVTVPITIHDFDPIVWEPDVIGPAAAVGVLLRWEGHHATRHRGPYDEPAPYGAICWYRMYSTVNRIEILPQEGGGVEISSAKRTLAFEVPYVFKAQVQTGPDGHLYKFKVWPQGDPEPAGWDLTNLQPLTDSDDGSVLLVTHYMEASFGTVTVTPLP